MVRPTFVIAEPAPPEGLSVRKLVIETAYFNVLTAYSAPELLAAIDRFPQVDAVIVHAELPKLDLNVIGSAVREKVPHAAFVVLTPSGGPVANGADAVLSSHEPQTLLGYLEERFGQFKQAG